MGRFHQAPPLKAADLLVPTHVYHRQFIRWLAERKERFGEKSAKPNKRKARLFLAQNNSRLRNLWPSIWKEHERAA